MNVINFDNRNARAAVFALAILFVIGTFALPFAARADDSGGDGGDGGDGGAYVNGGYLGGGDDSGSYTDSIDYTYPEDTSSYTDSIDYTYPEDTSSYTDSIDYTYPADDTEDINYTDYAPETDVYGNETTEENGVGYSNQNYSSTGSASYSSAPITFSAPASYYSAPVSYPSYPTPIYTPPVQQPPTVVTQPSVTNTCTNNSCNYADYSNNSVNISNSGNTSIATVVPVTQYPVTYPVQYTFPQPIYNQQVIYQQPYCSISFSGYGGYNYGSYGTQLASLTWNSSYGTSAYISPNVGSVAPSGSETVYPVPGQIYTMTVTGPYGSANCETQSTYVPPTPAPSVTLSQIPYTGFDFGPIGDSIYWLSLLSFSAALAYLAIYYRGGFGILASAYAPRATRKVEKATSAPVRMVQSVVAPVARKIDAVIAPTQQVKHGTSDSMTLARAENGKAPRIVISRS